MNHDAETNVQAKSPMHRSAVMGLLDRYPLLVLGLLLMGAFTSSSAAPLAGLYVVEGLGQAPWKLSLVAIVQVCVTLLVNRSFGRAIDRAVPVKFLLITSILCFAAGMTLLGLFQIYWVYLGIVSILLGVGSGALSVMYSFGRLFAEQTGRDVVKFNGFLRMQTSLGWMVGPAASLSFYGVYGFAPTYYAIAGLAAIWFAACLLIVPAAFKTHHPNSLKSGEKVPFNFGLLSACVPVFFIGAANVVFVSAMPLYFSTELGLVASSAGFALTVKCFVEVVVIYFCASLIKRVGERKGMLIAALLGAIFFGLIYQATTLVDVLVLATLDGIYYGIFAGISMTFVQNFAPDQPGVATSYYVSTLFVGGLIGNLLTGVVASVFDFQTTVLMACAFAFVGAAVLAFMRDANRSEPIGQG
ncbi:MFS transporter [Thalassospira sp. HF15]|uniref:MFS transporter n=1 Tax=Thalassospira sp. HF15 TaxID=2722755 RepID=UPI001431951C|nr:MFS transporter [Thalassospira sp. HF15]NIY76288.1 MFS transporter [Thalassospira sp. HF15]